MFKNLKEKSIHLGPAIFLMGYQALLLASLPFYFYYHDAQAKTLVTAVLLLFLTGLSITAGYHRLYSHRSFRTNPFIEGIILFFGSMACQGSALRWSYDHRIHHAFVDTDSDPYSIRKGFWYAHCLWLLDKPRRIEPSVVGDLLKNPLVQFQHRHYESLMLFTNFSVFLLTSWLLDDILGSFVLCWWLRMFCLHHSTWFINSLAHTFGSKPFSQEQTAVNNWIVALLTFGEGYHNYHHTFANDYRNGVRWFHYDPTKWLIFSLQKLGLAYHLKKVGAHTIKKKMVQEHKKLLLEKLSNYIDSKKDDWEKQVCDLSERLLSNLVTLSELKTRCEQLKKDASMQAALEAIQIELNALKKDLSQDWKAWSKLSRSILNGCNLAPNLINCDGLGSSN